MSLARNLLAGLANSVWSALVGLAVVPFYLKYLGVEAYGLIGFFVTTQAVLSLLDMGMAPTINREVARCSATGNLKEAGKLLHTLAVVYWCMAGAIALLIVALAPLIAGYWLQSKQLSPTTISHAVMLMGLVVACRWPIGLYQGALIGAQRLAVSSGINMAMVTISSLGAVAVLAFVSQTIEAFFVWQASVGLVYAFTIRAAAWRIIGRIRQNRFEVDELKRIWRFTAGMSVISLMGVVFTQLDKVLLSRMLGLEEFAHYMLATVVVSSLYFLVTPVYNVVHPRLSALVIAGNAESLEKMYRLSIRILSIFLFPVAMLLAVYADDLVFIWTGNSSLASSVAPIIALLAMGSALNGVMVVPHALQIAFGMTRLPIVINGVLMIFLLPLITYLSLTYGAIGGALAWFILHINYVLLSVWLTHRSLLRGVGKKLIFNDVGVPLGVTLVAAMIALYFGRHGELDVYIRMVIGGGLALFSIGIGVALTPKLRALILSHFHVRKALV